MERALPCRPPSCGTIPHISSLASLKNNRCFMNLLLMTVFGLLGVAAGQAESAEIPTPKAVLVTGASTGIGRMVTERLAADGYFVYATARKPEDLKALGEIKNVQALPLDVTHPE